MDILTLKKAQKYADKGLGLKASKEQEEWITPTLINGWEHFGPPFRNAGYFKDEFGIVHLKGLVKNGELNGIIFELAVGYRNPQTLYFPTMVGDVMFNLEITNGKVKLGSAATKNNWVTLENISFRAEG